MKTAVIGSYTGISGISYAFTSADELGLSTRIVKFNNKVLFAYMPTSKFEQVIETLLIHHVALTIIQKDAKC